MSNSFGGSAVNVGTQSQLAYIATQAAEIDKSLECLEKIKCQLRDIVIQCDPMAFPSGIDHQDGYAATASSDPFPAGHIATIITTQNNIQQTIEEELASISSVIDTLRMLVG